MELLLFITLVALAFTLLKMRAGKKNREEEVAKWADERRALQQRQDQIDAENRQRVRELERSLAELGKFRDVLNASVEAQRLRSEAENYHANSLHELIFPQAEYTHRKGWL